MTSDGKVCILSGGVGGAKLVLGMSEILDPKEFIVVANTGDDFVHLGLHISPDIDTLVYTLAGMVDGKSSKECVARFKELCAKLKK